MIVCTKCSTQNQDDDEFCGGCGEFLEWAGQKVTSEAAPPAASSAPPMAAAPAAPDAPPAPPPAPTPRPVPAPAPSAMEPDAVPPPEPPVTTEPIAKSPPASVTPTPPPPASPAPPVKPASVQPAPVQPAPVLPSKPVPKRAEPTPAAKVEPALKPGEVACAACGAGNEGARSFCRRCGASLAPAPEEAKKPSWFRKLVTKDPKVHVAGDRPMRDKKGKFKP